MNDGQLWKLMRELKDTEINGGCAGGEKDWKLIHVLINTIS